VIPHDASLPDPSNHLPPPQPEPAPIAGRIEGPHLMPSRSPVTAHVLPPAMSAGPDVMSLLTSLRRRWISAVLLGSILAALTAVATFHLMEPKNTAMASLFISATPQVMSESRSGETDFRTYMQTAANQIMSRPVILAAMRSDSVKRLGLEAKDPDLASTIQENLKADTKEGSQLLGILYQDKDPKAAVVITDALKNAFMDEIYYNEQKQRANRVTELEKVLTEQKDQLLRKKANLARIVKTEGDPTAEIQKRLELLQARRDAQTQLAGIEFKLVEKKAELENLQLREKMEKSPQAAELSSPDVTQALESDPLVAGMKKRIADLEILYEDYVRKGGENYPSAVAIKDRIESIQRQIEKRRPIVLERLRKQGLNPGGPRENIELAKKQIELTINRLNDLQVSVKKNVEELTEQSKVPPKQMPEVESAMNDIQCTEKLVSELSVRMVHEQIELHAAPRVVPFQDAQLMKKEDKKQLLATAATPMGMIGLVCVGLAWLDVRQRRIRCATQVSRGLGIRVMGAVPNTPGLERTLASPMVESELAGTPVLESIDALRTQLLHEEASGHPARLVMVTSAVTGEGKTTLAAHLAGSLARAGRKTLLVDGDLRRPTIHQLFEMPQQPGLSEVLLGEVEVSEAWQDSTSDNLTIMTAGQWDREVLLSLSRGSLEGVFEKLVEEFDFVIVDSHPVLAATDSLLLGRQVDAVILSVLREVSQIPKVYAAAQKMQTLGIPVLGAVVNGTDPDEVFTSTSHAAPQMV
jgi:polysaccharide biosynthesis transport protein